MGNHPIETIFVEANGLRFEVLTCGSGETLALCLHGFPEVALSWREQMPALAAAGYRVWAPNQRGYGQSSRPPRMEDYAIEHLLDDAAGLIDASGANRVVLLGHDWGGIVAGCFATRRVRAVERLVIINVPHPACFARSLRRPGQMLRSWYVAAFQIPWLPEWLLQRNGAQAIGKSMLGSSSAPDSFPRDLVEAAQANAAQPGALKAMIAWYRAFVCGGGLQRQARLGSGDRGAHAAALGRRRQVPCQVHDRRHQPVCPRPEDRVPAGRVPLGAAGCGRTVQRGAGKVPRTRAARQSFRV